MKIRTDFVTNSSSSSFVSYNLHDSEFCRYVYEKMQEKGLSYKQYSPYSQLPGSYVEFDKNSLHAEINLTDPYGDPEDGYICEMYAPECWCWNGYFGMSIEQIEDYLEDDSAKEAFCQILDEELKETSFEKLLNAENWNDDYTWMKYNKYYRGKKISDSENFHLCGRLFALLSDCKYDDEDCIKKQDDMIHIMSDSDDEEADFIDLFSDCLYAVAFDGYHSYEKDEDIWRATDSFIPLISNFVPVYPAAEENEEKLYELFEKDRKNGKFSCNVYMGSTD